MQQNDMTIVTTTTGTNMLTHTQNSFEFEVQFDCSTIEIANAYKAVAATFTLELPGNVKPILSRTLGSMESDVWGSATMKPVAILRGSVYRIEIKNIPEGVVLTVIIS